MDLAALANCLGTVSCVVTQASSGLIIGMLLFLVASGLTLIFGVLGVVNFAHGTLYMLGAYLALAAYQLTGSFLAATVLAALGVALAGVLFERLLMSRVYGADVLMQLLVCYAVILIMDDVVRIVWGAEFLKMGMPEAFRLPPIRLAGGIVPPYYLFLTAVTLAVAVAMALVLARTRFGKLVRAAAHNRAMVEALGVNTAVLYAALFGLGSMVAGAAGALAAPIRSLVPGMGFSIVIESFIVTVIGGMGSIAGALLASVLVGVTRSFGSIGFPLFTDGLMFVLMAAVLLLKPTGLFGRREG